MHQHDYWFRLKEVSLFPPRCNDLIVAKLEASSSWHALYEVICTITSTMSDLQHLVDDKKSKVWTSHITLANIVDMKGQAKQNL
jgi:hypothetical protein